MCRIVWSICLAFLIAGILTGLVLALEEEEPNDSPAEANSLVVGTPREGEIGPVGDRDYYSLEGVNRTWGFIALLETDSSTSGRRGTLTALGSDASTLLQTDTGSWQRGSGIALQSYADAGATHYLRVEEEGNDDSISAYTLRIYQTVVDTQPEVEPNGTRSAGTPSAFTHSGTLSSSDDVDCFAFEGRADDTILLALNGDPENDNSPVDYQLELVDEGDTVLQTADVTGNGGNEFIEYPALAEAGIYAYCVRAAAGTGGAGATYTVGLVRNGGLYFPSYVQGPTWLNPRPGGMAYVDDTLTFRLAMTNTSPLPIPGAIDLMAIYAEECLEYLSASSEPTESSPGDLRWEGLASDLAPGEAHSISVDFRARSLCVSAVKQSTIIRYYVTGTGGDADYAIHTPLFLPAAMAP